MRIDILTIFPDLCRTVLGESILKLAQEKGVVECHVHDIRDFTDDKRRTIDDRPFGGGPGMVMMPEPLSKAIEHVKTLNKGPVLYMTPAGERFVQKKARELAATSGFILLCGRYEGIDQRVIDSLVDEEISIGEYVLSGGELPALVITEAVTRLLPGALGDDESTTEESFSEALGGKKEYPQYTRPAEFRDMKVPDILLSGNHEEIKKWRLKNTR